MRAFEAFNRAEEATEASRTLRLSLNFRRTAKTTGNHR